MSSVSGFSASDDSGDTAWEVSEICAERTSICGEHQVLVVWKTSWIPMSRLDADGPVMLKWQESAKWRSSPISDICVALPAESGSQLAKEIAMIADRKARLLVRPSASPPSSEKKQPRSSQASSASRRLEQSASISGVVSKFKRTPVQTGPHGTFYFSR
jgi:hypothetical protein